MKFRDETIIKKEEPYGVLAIWNDIEGLNEDEYHEWYIQEHLLERLHLTGFLHACRYKALGPGPQFFTYYLTASVEVLRSSAYLERINNPTEWTRQNMAGFRNMNRTACRQIIDLGKGIGSAAITLEVKPKTEKKKDLREKVAEVLFPDLLQSPGTKGLIRARLWEGDPSITGQKTSELELRGGKDKMIAWALIIEACTPEHARKGAEMLARSPLREWGAEKVEQPCVYLLWHYLPAPDGR